MIKPRLSYEGEEWACTGGSAYGFGLTPQEAYDDWMFDKIHYDALWYADGYVIATGKDKHPKRYDLGFWRRVFNSFKF